MASRGERAVFWAVLALLLAGTAVAYRLLLGPEPGRAERAAPQAAAPVRLTVSRAEGEVTVVRGGVRTRVAPGAELRSDDAIETGPGARVALAGGSYEVTLEEGGRFDVREITAELSRFHLASGLVSTNVQEERGRAVEIEAASGAVARTTSGEMAMARSGNVIAVGVRRGTAEFRSAGKAVLLKQGEQSVAAAGEKPSPPAPIPASLLLKVSWPAERATNQRRIVVTGRTAPGAVVLLGDERVEVQPDGRFTHVVVLREGRQRLMARAHAVGGAAQAEGPILLLDTRAPDARFETRDLWVQPRK
jgi:hypothetical protein